MTTTIHNYESLGKMLGMNYWSAYRLAQAKPTIGFMVGKRRYFSDEDVRALRAFATFLGLNVKQGEDE